MNSSKLTFLILFISQLCFSQSNDNQKFQLGLQSNYFLAGELNATYDISTGIEAKYFLKHTEKFHHFINATFTTDIGTTGANLFVYDIGLGSQYDFLQLFKKPLFFQLNAGLLYWQEYFSTQLIEATISNNTSQLGFKANLGIGYRISNKLNVAVNASQFNTHGTTIGISLHYSF